MALVREYRPIKWFKSMGASDGIECTIVSWLNTIAQATTTMLSSTIKVERFDGLRERSKFVLDFLPKP